jgi:uncharacterized protein (TIGR02594 family)
MGNNPIGMIDPDGGKADDWYLPKGETNQSKAVWIDGSGPQEGYNWLGGENFNFGTFNLDAVSIMGKSKSGNFSTPWMDTAISQFGVKELTGNNDGGKVKEYLRTTGLGEGYAWCSAFVNWNMKQNGIKGTNNAQALSWRKWGESLSKPAYGSIATLTRKGGGHVGFVAASDGNRLGWIVILGGNQSDEVNYRSYPLSILKFNHPQNFVPLYKLSSMHGVHRGIRMK